MHDTAKKLNTPQLRLARPIPAEGADRLQGFVYHPFFPFPDDAPPEIPSSVVPGPIRELVVGKSQELEVPVVMPLACALGVASAVIQSRWAVEVRVNYIEPTSLWLLVAADPGELKTPTMGPILAPLVEYEREQRQRAADVNKANATGAGIIADRVKQLRRVAAKADTAIQREELAKQIDDLQSEIPPVARPTRVLADDATPERLARLMGENHGAMAVVTDEGGAFLNRLAGHYSNGSPNIDFALKGFDNGQLRVDRSNGNDVHLNHARLAVCLLAQKSVARTALTNEEFMSRGLIHRFLCLLPGSSRVGHRTFDAQPVPQHVTNDWASLVKALLSWSPASVDEWGTTTHIIKMSQPARERFWQYHATMERVAGTMDEGDPRRVYRLKWCGYVARLAGVMHCLDVVAGQAGVAPHARFLHDDTMSHAIGLASMLLDHADTALGMLGQDMRLERARRILARVDAENAEISSAELWRRVRHVTSLFDGREQFVEAIKLLVERGYLAWRAKGKSEYYVLSEGALAASSRPNRAHGAPVL